MVRKAGFLLLSCLLLAGQQADARDQKAAPAARAQTVIQNYAPRPALWKLADEDTTIYLFGTTHALPRGFKWRTPAIDAAARASDELVLETVDAPADDKAVDTALDDILAEDSSRLPLSRRISASKRDALGKAMAKATLPEQVFDLMPTWLAAFTLSVGDMAQQGQTTGFGVEAFLQKQFAARKCRIVPVEDGDAILRQMHAMSEAAQVAMLEDAIEDVASANGGKAGVSESDHGWARGQVASLDKEFNEDAMGVELYDILIRKRNIAWTAWLKARLAKPGTVFFAVGAGHFAGPDSVLAMLDKDRLRVERVQ